MRFCSQARPFQAPVSAVTQTGALGSFASDVAILDYKAEDFPLDNLEPSSPASRELRDFETYNRTALPLLVEANLRAIVESQIAPIEERVRAMVVDIVRTCQSTVARNFHLTIAPTSLANSRTQSSSEVSASAGIAVGDHGEPAQVPMDRTADSPMEFFPELSHLNLETSAPPHLNSEASGSLQVIPQLESITENMNQDSDLGFTSPLFPCGCSCHDYSNNWNTANGENFSNHVCI